MKKIDWQYTFGEILIVIIGITIAFSLNRCSENAKQAKLEQQYLKSLKEDIDTDRNSLSSNLEKLEKKKELLQTSFRYFNPTIPKRDSLLASSFFNSAQVIEFSAKNTTYQTLINSGDLNIISNFELKTSIQEHYRNYGKLQQDYDRMVNISKKYIADYYIYNLDFDKFRKGEQAFSNEKLLKSIMQSMYGAVNFKIASTEKGIHSCENLLEVIEASLN